MLTTDSDQTARMRRLICVLVGCTSYIKNIINVLFVCFSCHSRCPVVQLINMSLSIRWADLNKKLGVPEDKSNRWWTIVQTRYSENQRYYHTLVHLEDMFQKFDIVKEKLTQPDAVALAVFFHE